MNLKLKGSSSVLKLAPRETLYGQSVLEKRFYKDARPNCKPPRKNLSTYNLISVPNKSTTAPTLKKEQFNHKSQLLSGLIPPESKKVGPPKTCKPGYLNDPYRDKLQALLTQ